MDAVAVVAPRLTLTPVTVDSVHDGDTLRVDVPLDAVFPEVRGFVPDVRVAHVNAAELATDQGKAAAADVRTWLSGHGPSFDLLVYGREKYGRLLADLRSCATGELLSAYVLTLTGTKPMTQAEMRERLQR